MFEVFKSYYYRTGELKQQQQRKGNLLPSPIPEWPKGEGCFNTGRIRLNGELELAMVTDFEPIWSSSLAGNKGARFYKPVSIPYGFFALGHYHQPTHEQLIRAYVLVARDTTTRGSPRPALKLPLGYNLKSMSLKDKVFVWEPIPPVGYRALGFVVTTCSKVGYQIEPDVQLVGCVREDLILDAPHLVATNCTLTTRSKGVPVSPTFFSGAHINCGDVLNLCYLKNSNLEATMPNLEQVKALINHFGPTVYFHPDEVYLPSSVPWYYENFSEEGSKHGCLETAEVYIQVKPAMGGAFTDIDMLIFFPSVRLDTFTLKLFSFNIELMNKKGGGEYVGHWEHFTLRISNFDGQLWRVYFPDHSGKKLVEATRLEFIEGSNKPIIYSSKFRHASFANAGTYIQGHLTNFGIGVKDEVAKSDMFIDTSKKYKIVVAEYLRDGAVVEPDWMRELRQGRSC